MEYFLNDWEAKVFLTTAIICCMYFLLNSYLINRQIMQLSKDDKKRYIYDVFFCFICIVPFLFFSFTPFITTMRTFAATLVTVMADIFLVISFFSCSDVEIVRSNPSLKFKAWWQFMTKPKYFVVLFSFIFGVLSWWAVYPEIKIKHIVTILVVLLWLFFLVFLACLRQRNKYFFNNQDISLSFFRKVCNLIYILIKTVANILTFVVIIIFFTSVIWMIIDPQGVDADVCLDTGYCSKGLILDDCFGDGRPCTVNETTCRQMNGKWQAEDKVCNTRSR